ncbi:MAG: hypothetical protein LBD10_06670 [Desulfobulbus sp.]|jgi:hypothetical protein|uniref:hypothetical protein n=1 Tax=Desulfobulbus sp. TaxID=895 RepID=UPI0028428939|nr:hypothetical protein [Desulfobulbus sp.]MDR2549861.1 hypothetical protein [Desulfobulbus sp.]
MEDVEKIDNVDNNNAVLGYGCMSIRLRHPSCDLSNFSSLLSMRCFRVWVAGSQRETPAGKKLLDVYKESYWCSESIRFSEKKGFSLDLKNIINRLKNIENEIKFIKSTGGDVEIYVNFLGSVDNGDTIDSSTLKTIGELGVNLSLEVFPKITGLQPPPVEGR